MECQIPPSDVSHTVGISAGGDHTLFLQSDGRVLALGGNRDGECNIPRLKPGMRYIGDQTPDIILQLEFVIADDVVTLICSNFAVEEQVRLNANVSDRATDSYKNIAVELKANLQSLRVVLPDGELLASMCRANPLATIGDLLHIWANITCTWHRFWAIVSLCFSGQIHNCVIKKWVIQFGMAMPPGPCGPVSGPMCFVL